MNILPNPSQNPFATPFMPAMKDIPEEFKYNSKNKWSKITSRWFFRGLPKTTKFICKPGIDKNMALQHISGILQSFEPDHEHKESAVSYLLSLWFEDIIL